MKLGKRGGRQLTLENFDFSNHELPSRVIEKAIFLRCTFADRKFEGGSFAGCQFLGCDMRGIEIRGTDLTRTAFLNIDGDPVRTTILDGARIHSDKLLDTVFQRVQLNNVTLSGNVTDLGDHGQSVRLAHISDCKNLKVIGTIVKFQLSDVQLNNGDFDEATLKSFRVSGDSSLSHCKFNGAVLESASLTGKEYLHCQFRKANLSGATLSGANLRGCRFEGADWRDATVIGCQIDYCNFRGGKNMHGRHGLTAKAVRGAENALYSRAWDFATWSRIRSFGTLRLFSVSYLALIAIWLYAVFNEWFNAQIELFKAKHEIVSEFPVLDKLQPLPHTPELATTAWAIVFLALAATIYHVACPPEVKENTESQWTHALGREGFDYRVQSWRDPALRWLAGFCYVFGGGYVVTKIFLKTWWAINYFQPGTG